MVSSLRSFVARGPVQFTLLAALVAHAAPAGVLLDAGPPAAPVLEGFAVLHGGGSDDPRATWTVPPHVVRGVPRPDPLIGDEVVGGTLHLDIPTGAWDVWVLLGEAFPSVNGWRTPALGLRANGVEVLGVAMPDPYDAFLASPLFAAAPRPVFRAGESAWRRQVAPGTPWRHARIDVPEGGVDLQAFGWPMHALVAFPAEARADAEVELSVADARREAWWRAHLHPEEDVLPAVVPGPLAVELSYADAYAPVGAGVASAREHLALARDDRTSRLVWILGGDAPGTVMVEAPGDLDVTVEEVSWLDSSVHPLQPLRPRPTARWEGDGWQGGQGLPPALLVTVATRADTRPGKRQVRLAANRAGQLATVDLSVNVADVVPAESPQVGLWGAVPYAPYLREGPDGPVVRDAVDQLLGLLAAHGLDALSLRHAGSFGKDDLDVGLLRHAARVWNGLGGRALLWPDVLAELRYRGDDGLSDALLAEALREAATADAPVWVMLHEEDDYRRPDGADLGIARGARARALVPEATLAAVPSTPSGWRVAQGYDIALIGGFGGYLEQGVRRARERGATPWAYNLPPGGSGPLLAWAARAEGLLEWHVDPQPADPFDHVSDPDRRAHILLGPDGRLHGTVILSDLADGAADARLMRALETAPLAPPARAEADRLLAGARAALLAAVPSRGADGALLTARARAAIRARALLLLSRAR